MRLPVHGRVWVGGELKGCRLIVGIKNRWRERQDKDIGLQMRCASLNISSMVLLS